MKQPTDSHYFSTYPEAVKLWLAGKPKESVHAFVKSRVQLILPGSKLKASAYANDCQQSENGRVGAKSHEAITDSLCKAAWAMCQAWPVNGPLLETNETYMALVREINDRREEWQKLYGVYRNQEKAKLAAIRLKKFTRLMRRMEKSLEKTCLSRSWA